MSAGKFVYAFYQLDNESVARIRVQPETITSGNPSATGPANLPVTVRVSNGNRAFGIKPRSITLKWTGAAPDGYDPNGILRVPILQRGTYNAINLGAAFTYAGASAQVVGKNPERVR